MSEDLDKRVGQYIEVRDKLKVLKEKHEAECKPLVDLQEILSGRIQQGLAAAHADNVKTKHGTAYLSTRYTASVADADVFMKYVIGSQKFDLLDRRANSTAVKDYVKDNGNLPPGVNLSSIQTVGVRRPTGKTE